MGKAGEKRALLRTALRKLYFFLTGGKERLTDVAAAADRTFPRFRQPGSLVKYEPALPAYGWNHLETQPRCAQRFLNMLQMSVDIPLRNPHLPGDVQGRNLFSGQKGHDRVPDGVFLNGGNRWFFGS